jgi:UDP-glucose 4-epimerase
VSTPGLMRTIADGLGLSCRLFHCPQRLLRIAGAVSGRGAEVLSLLASLAADTRKIQRQLKWKPAVDLPAGIAATLADYRTQKTAGSRK